MPYTKIQVQYNFVKQKVTTRRSCGDTWSYPTSVTLTLLYSKDNSIVNVKLRPKISKGAIIIKL
jgi:hypothetical protein